MKQKTVSISEDLHSKLVEMKAQNFKAENVTFEEVIRDLMEDDE
jgi:predicted CopG family antitoxin